MLFLARMDVAFPAHLSAEEIAEYQTREREYSAALQRRGTLRHLWRIVGEFANHSVFEVSSHEELHRVLSEFPMFAFMRIRVTPLAQHPNALE